MLPSLNFCIKKMFARIDTFKYIYMYNAIEIYLCAATTRIISYFRHHGPSHSGERGDKSKHHHRTPSRKHRDSSKHCHQCGADIKKGAKSQSNPSKVLVYIYFLFLYC